jgi:hypothetical protein
MVGRDGDVAGDLMQPRSRLLRGQLRGVLPPPQHRLLDHVLGGLPIAIDDRKHEPHQRRLICGQPGDRAVITARRCHTPTTPRRPTTSSRPGKGGHCDRAHSHTCCRAQAAAARPPPVLEVLPTADQERPADCPGHCRKPAAPRIIPRGTDQATSSPSSIEPTCVTAQSGHLSRPAQQGSDAVRRPCTRRRRRAVAALPGRSLTVLAARGVAVHDAWALYLGYASTGHQLAALTRYANCRLSPTACLRRNGAGPPRSPGRSPRCRRCTSSGPKVYQRAIRDGPAARAWTSAHGGEYPQPGPADRPVLVMSQALRSGPRRGCLAIGTAWRRRRPR